MRNNGIGYGLSSLKVFNFLYGLMKVEGYGLTDKIKFSELLELANVGSNKISETLDKYLSIICEDLSKPIDRNIRSNDTNLSLGKPGFINVRKVSSEEAYLGLHLPL